MKKKTSNSLSATGFPISHMWCPPRRHHHSQLVALHLLMRQQRRGHKTGPSLNPCPTPHHHPALWTVIALGLRTTLILIAAVDVPVPRPLSDLPRPLAEKVEEGVCGAGGVRTPERRARSCSGGIGRYGLLILFCACPYTPCSAILWDQVRRLLPSILTHGMTCFFVITLAP